MSDKKKYLTPAAMAAVTYSQLCDIIDDAEMIDAKLRRAFKDSHEDHQYRVDKRTAMKRWFDAQRKAAEDEKKYYIQMIAGIDAAEERFNEMVLEDMAATPNIEFRGKLGKIWIQDTESVDLIFGKSPQITPDMKTMMNVDDKYVRQVFIISKEAVAADLAAGKKLPWASLKHKKTPRFPVVKKPKPKELDGDDSTYIDIIGEG